MSQSPDTNSAGDTVTWAQLWRQTEQVLGSRTEARWLCEHASGLDGDEFVEVLGEEATVRMVNHLDTMVSRYRAGEPLAYVMGRWAFRHLDLMVDRRVLIPRPETELLVDVVVQRLPDPGDDRLRLVDLGTGSGAIGLSLAHELWHRQPEVWLTDASLDALEVARANLAGIGRAGSGVRLSEGPWFHALPQHLQGTLHAVVSNPPYVAVDDPELDPSVRDWEPTMALLAGDDGLADLQVIIEHTPQWLVTGGVVALEIGYRQGDAVAALLQHAGFVEVDIQPDLAGRPRIAVGRQPKRAAI
jgi:release factor glutamine methyltransferase